MKLLLYVFLICAAWSCSFGHSEEKKEEGDDMTHYAVDAHGNLDSFEDANASEGERIYTAKEDSFTDAHVLHDHDHDHEDHGHDHHDHSHCSHDAHDHDHHDHSHCSHDHDHDHDHEHAHEHEDGDQPPHADCVAGWEKVSHGNHFHWRCLDNNSSNDLVAFMWTLVSGFSGALGGVFVILAGQPSEKSLGHLLSFAAGVMLYLSFVDLYMHVTQPDALGRFWGNVWIFIGMAGFLVITTFLPEAADDPVEAIQEAAEEQKKEGTEVEEVAPQKKKPTKLFLTGVIAAIGITLHNFPEGLVVFVQTRDVANVGRGLAVAFAIILHNIPEGMAVASPIYGSTKSKWEAMKWCLLSSLAEPAAALLVWVAFTAVSPTAAFLQILNALVAGIMIMLCLVELIPTAASMTSPKAAAVSHFAGQAVMFISLELMIMYGAH